MSIQDIYDFLKAQFENHVNSSVDFCNWLKKAQDNAIAFISNANNENYINSFPEDGMLMCNIASDIKGNRISKQAYVEIFNEIDYPLLNDLGTFPHNLFEDVIKNNPLLHQFSNLTCNCKNNQQQYVRITTVENFIAHYPNYLKSQATAFTGKDKKYIIKELIQPNNQFSNREYKFSSDAIRNLVWVASYEEFSLRKNAKTKVGSNIATYLMNCLGLPMEDIENDLVYFVYPNTFDPVMYFPLGMNAKWVNNNVFFLSYACNDHDEWGRTRTYLDDDPNIRMKERVHKGASDYHICSPEYLGTGIFENKKRNNIIEEAIQRFYKI